MQTLVLEHPADETSRLLEACDTEGAIRIVAEGKSYVLRSVPVQTGRIRKLPDFQKRFAFIFPQTLTAEQTAAADRMIGGE